MSVAPVLLLITLLLGGVEEIYCQNITSWIIGSSNIPLARSNWVTGYHKSTDTVWMLGGWGSAGYGNAVISYHIANDTFVEHPNLASISSLYSEAQSFTVINDILFFNTNGTLGIFNMSAETEIYPWPVSSAKHKLPIFSNSACLATDGRYLFFAGGQSSSINGVDYFQIFDTYNEIWIMDGPAMDNERIRHACIVKNGDFYVFGGQSSTSSAASS